VDAETLTITGIRAGYGPTTVLHGIDMTVPAGKSVGLLGPNGHGKTTLLRTISGLQRPTAGSIHWGEQDLTRSAPRHVIGEGIVHIPQGCRLFPELSVHENLVLGAHNPQAREAIDDSLSMVYGLFPKLSERQRQWGGTLSGGERQMVAIGMGLMARPRLLMLDEPTLGLAPKIKEQLIVQIADIRASGVRLLLIDGDVDFVMSLTDEYYVLEGGVIVRHADSSEDVEEEEMMNLYFGGDHG
jgi:branched-chain amino acid transport system ATP-binding protein